jgi:hypothetical protein
MARTCNTGLLLAAVIMVVGGTAFALRPRGPMLEWYRSGPIMRDGLPVRVQVLVPQGWEPEVQQTNGSGMHVALFRPRVRLGWLPAWLRKAFAPGASSGDGMGLVVGADSHAPDGSARMDACLTIPGYVAGQSVEGGWGAIKYLRVDRAEFEATHRQICESFQVIEEPQP